MTKHVLIVDAVPDSRFSNVIALKNHGYITSESSDGSEALAMILDAQDNGTPFDMIVVAVQMPEMKGMELISELNKNTVSTPVLAISNLVNRTLMMELVRNCCSDLLLKPFDAQELAARIEGVMQRHDKGFFAI